MADALLTSQVRVANHILNFLTNTREKRGRAAQTIPYLEARLQLLERYYSDLFSRHEKLLPHEKDNSNHEYFKKNAFELAEDAYIEAQAELKEDIQNLRQPQQNVGVGARRGNGTAGTDHVKVPRVSLPTFSGKQEEWESFKQRFSSLIKDKAEYADVDKLQYLLSTVEGKAAERLRGIEVTNENFEVAWDKLTKRYDNKRKRLSTHLEALINLPTVRPRNLLDLEKLLDSVEVAVRGLNELGCLVQHYDNWFVHCIVKKLDSHSRETWEISQETKEGFYTYKDLSAFLERRMISLDQAHGKSEPRDSSGSTGKPTNSKSRKPTSTSVYTAGIEGSTSEKAKSALSCFICHEKHSMHSCGQFKEMTPHERFSRCKKERLCLNCLRKGHMQSDCTSPNRCLICKQRHHTKLHFDNSSSGTESSSAMTVEEKSDTHPSTPDSGADASCSAHLATTKQTVLLATAKVLVCDKFNNTFVARALIDPGAQRSFISERLATQLHVKRRPVSVSILGVGGQITSRARGEITFTLKSRIDANFCCQCTALVLNEVTALLPAKPLQKGDWTHLKGLQLADATYFSPGKIDVILGADLYCMILQEGLVRGPPGAPLAQKTPFGWILTGVIDTQEFEAEFSQATAYHTIAESTLKQSIEKFWEIEELPTQSILTADEEYCDQYFAATYSRNSQGRFVVRLPFSRREPFPNARNIAVACLKRSEKRRARNPAHQTAYSDFIKEYVQLGHMEVASEPPRSTFSYYMPHHGIYRADSNKIRVVFNASQKTASGLSLNDILLPGRKLQRDITLIILLWRFYKVALVTDIVKMFRQFLIHKDDLDWQRVVWRELTTEEITELIALTVTYGTACAPYLALSALIQLAKDGQKSFPLAAFLLLYLTYVDDIFLGADDEQKAREIRDQLIQLLATAGMELGKWASNRPALLKDVGDEPIFDLPSSSGDIVSTLGLKWDTGADEFQFGVTLQASPSLVTKRSVLADTARLYDPLGFIAPVIIQAKILLQDLWIDKLEWDTPLPQYLLDRWISFRVELSHLPEIRIPRWIGVSATTPWHLHGFADASTRAYAAVVYAVVPSRGSIILMSKTRVAPVKVETLPRLELCGAALLIQLTKHLMSGTLQEPDSINFWIDSRIVLDWLQSHPSRWPTFVANRVSLITSSFPDAKWRHVGTKDNPADCASRGMSPSDLARFQLWWTGPEWLLDAPTEWPCKSPSKTEIQALVASEEEKAVGREETIQPFLEEITSFSKIVRVLAYCLRWKRVITEKPHHFEMHLSVSELSGAKHSLFLILQRDAFGTDCKRILTGKPISRHSPLARLAPFVDKKGILRVGGRLQNTELPYSERHPIILPGGNRVVKRLVEEAHRLTLHGGALLMQSFLTRSYWITRLRRLLTAVYRRCVTCIRFATKPLQQRMAPLPADRVLPGRPFATTGIDYAGPFSILRYRGRGARTSKGYVAIFVCLVVKAIHVEIVSDLTSDSFLAAFSRFIARRGTCSTIYSDNGTTFKGADAELRRLFEQSSVFSTDVFATLTNQGIVGNLSLLETHTSADCGNRPSAVLNIILRE